LVLFPSHDRAAAVRPIGNTGDVLTAYVDGSNTLIVGVNGNTATTSSTGYPLSVAASPSLPDISFFSVAEDDTNVYFTIQVYETGSGSTLTSQQYTGYLARP
jgi:hypothetical protein